MRVRLHRPTLRIRAATRSEQGQGETVDTKRQSVLDTGLPLSIRHTCSLGRDGSIAHGLCSEFHEHNVAPFL